MKRLAMVGTEIIHTYPYLAYFNGFDPDLLQKNAKPWMAKMLEGKPNAPCTANARVTHVWAGDPAEAARLAASCRIPHVAASPHEFIDAVDGVLVMDEVIDARAGLVRPFIEAGKAVFVDKTLSLDGDVTAGLLTLAEKTAAPLAACSQLRFAPGFAEVRGMARGGAALASFRMNLDILAKYSIHLVSAVQGVFGTGVVEVRKLAGAPQSVEIRVRYADQTRVTLCFGPNVPPGGNLCYLGPDSARLAAAGDMHAMFQSSAQAIERLVCARQSAVSVDEIREASCLIEFLVQAGTGETKVLRS